MHRLMLHLACRSTAAALVALLSVSAGCATSRPVTKDELVFPPPPETARIRWTRSFAAEEDLGRSWWRKMFQSLLPHDKANAIVGPTGLALSPDEKTLYVALPHRSRIAVVDLAKGTISSLATRNAALARPTSVAVDAEGLVYASDMGAGVVAVYGPRGGIVRKFGKEVLVEPGGIAIDRKRQVVYVVNDATRREGRHSVEAFSLAGKHLRTLGGTRSPEMGSFNFPRSLAVSRSGELFVADMLNFRVQVFDPAGQIMRSFGEAGTGFPGHFDKIRAIAFDAFDNVYIADAMQGVHILNDESAPLMIFGPPAVRAASAIVIDSKNHIYVADMLHAIHEFDLINTTSAADSHRKREPSEMKPAPVPAAAPASGARGATPGDGRTMGTVDPGAR